MKAKIISPFLFLFFAGLLSSAAFSQFHRSSINDDYSFMNTSPRFGMTMGTSFTTGFGGGMFSQSIAPNLTLTPGKRFSVQVGSVLSSSSFSGVTNPVLSNAAGNRMFSTTIYALGAYQLNPRLTLTGGAWAERNNMNAFTPQMNPHAFDLNGRSGMMMGMDYRITDNLRFGAEVNVSRGGLNPFDPYNMQNGSMYNMHPQRRDPFRRTP